MEAFDEFEFYKDIYAQENSRRNDIQDHLNIPFALVSAYITAIYFLLSNFDYKISYSWNITFLFTGLLSIVITAVSIYFLIRALGSFKANEYKGVPYPNELKEWKGKLDDYYNDNQSSDNEFKIQVLKIMIDCSTHNMFVNDNRFKYIYKSKRFLVLGLISLFILASLFGVNNYLKNVKSLPNTKETNIKTRINVGTHSIINSSTQNHGRQYTKSDSKSDSSSTIKSTTSPKRKDYKRGRNPQSTQTNTTN